MKHNTQNENAVSPVIGVILMISITVILAAIVAAFVFGMAGSMTTTKIVAGSAQKIDASHIAVTYYGGQDAPMVKSINWTLSPIAGTKISYEMDVPMEHSRLMVGTTKTLSSSDFNGSTHVVAVASFVDDTQQVILDQLI